MVKILPKLFAKHQSETSRMTEVMRLVQTLKLDMYLELRLVSVSIGSSPSDMHTFDLG